MRFTPQHLKIQLVALAMLGALGCGDANPVAPEHANSARLRAGETGIASAKGENNGKKADVHAIHVALTNMVFNTTIVDRYSFHAMKHGLDDVKGHFYFYQVRIIDGEEVVTIIASGPMECVTVVGNKAKVGGRVTYTTFPEGIPVGSEVTWSATDNGKSANADDSASQPLGNNARAYCDLGLPYPEAPVERGKIQIKS